MPDYGNGNVILIGMMGCGKSTLGKQLARRLKRGFVDSDEEVVRRTGASISTIFELEGETGFRHRETEALRDILTSSGIVLATGGGAILSPENRALFVRTGAVIYLHTDIETLYERTRHTKARPLLDVEDPKRRLALLYDVRDPLYRQTAHLTVESTQGRVSTLLNRVVESLQRRGPPWQT